VKSAASFALPAYTGFVLLQSGITGGTSSIFNLTTSFLAHSLGEVAKESLMDIDYSNKIIKCFHTFASN
jgi:hypothetical protein